MTELIHREDNNNSPAGTKKSKKNTNPINNYYSINNENDRFLQQMDNNNHNNRQKSVLHPLDSKGQGGGELQQTTKSWFWRDDSKLPALAFAVAFIGEGMGTFLLILLGCGAIVTLKVFHRSRINKFLLIHSMVMILIILL